MSTTFKSILTFNSRAYSLDSQEQCGYLAVSTCRGLVDAVASTLGQDFKMFQRREIDIYLHLDSAWNVNSLIPMIKHIEQW